MYESGRWAVYTDSGSTYFFDSDDRTIMRTRGNDASVLRKDGEIHRLEAILDLAVGRCGIFVVSGLAEHGPTIRYTTIVNKIERLS